MVSVKSTRFIASLCQVCRSKETPCSCSVCHMVFYCSPAHRRLDWYQHSSLCWAFNKICQGRNVERLLDSLTGADFTDFRHGVANECIRLLGRKLEARELETIYHPRVCDVCLESDWQRLRPCEKCEFVYSCEKNHFRKDHEKWCKSLKIYVEIVEFDIRPECEDWNLINYQADLRKSNMTKIIDVIFSRLEKNESRFANAEKALISDLLTYPLTVLNSLRQIDVLGKRKLSVLLIGAENQAEVEPFEKWENYLAHQIPETEIIHLTFLGPELNGGNEDYSKRSCETCRKNGRKIICEMIGGKFYHEYSSRMSNKTDLICAFNAGMYRDCGFAGKDSWKDTLVALFTKQSTPVVITEYTSHELKRDLEKLEKITGKPEFVSGPGRNPFGGLNPGINLIKENDVPVTYKNYYGAIMKPRFRGD